MGLSKPLGWCLAVLLLANVLLFGLSIKSAEDVAQAQLKSAMVAADQPDKRVSPEVAAKAKQASTSVQVEQQICRVLGPYERALTAATVLKRLEQAGAVTELLTTQDLRAANSVATDVVLPDSMYWVKAVQASLLQGAKPEELASAKLCD